MTTIGFGNRRSISAWLVVGTLAIAGLLIMPCLAPAQAVAMKPCHDHPKLQGSCFDLRGRLFLANGTPEYRIWPVGTSRVLGVSASESMPGYQRLPDAVANLVSWDQSVLADFTVCPFTGDEPGRMRLVCVDAARNVRTVPAGKK